MKKTNHKIRQFGWIAIVAFIFSCSNGQSKSKAETIKITEATENPIPAFDIKFPETDFKIEKTENRDPKLGNILITNWILQGKDENGPFMYFVSHNEYPKKLKESEASDPKSLEAGFQAMLTSSALKLGGTEFEFTNIHYKDFKGMESICKVFNGDGMIKSRVYKIDNELFMISAGGKKISIDPVDNFLNSFGLKEL